VPAFKFEFARTDPVKTPLIAEPEDASPENYDRLKHEDYFVGEWTGEGSLPWGQDFTTEVVTNWTLNRNFLHTTFAAEVDNQVIFEHISLRAWDSSTSQVKEWSFNSWGGIGEAVVTRQGDTKRIVESEGLDSDGREVTAKNVITIRDENTYSAVTSQTIDGQAMEDISAEYKRKKP